MGIRERGRKGRRAKEFFADRKDKLCGISACCFAEK
jgi:hypothetical protein